MTDNPKSPDALLVLGTRCPHCPTVLQGLSDLVKQGKLGRLEVINLDQRPEEAQARGIRSVPWMRIGPFELEGLRSPAELRQWVERAASPSGLTDYFSEMLTEGRLAQVERVINAKPEAFAALLPLLGDPETELQVRVGIGALAEEYAGQPALQGSIEQLGELSTHDDARIRNDACYYLGLSGSADARPYLEQARQDQDSDVRETAEEALAELAN
jgi:hypothetical protein